MPPEHEEKLNYPSFVELGANGHKGNHRLAALLPWGAALSALPRPGKKIEIVWRSDTELKREAAEFKALRENMRIVPGREYEVLEYWATS
ncbi:hypothetical protein GCM10007359_11570 [Rothia aerolata]|uniref:Uncharacterized protein n=1 Tax=Rothia aerolata TaxID=1812262 RepID=A0A917IU21_9MICC|nr:hypothetical protein GCM10007359_11570 [Rothia aerolata]